MGYRTEHKRQREIAIAHVEESFRQCAQHVRHPQQEPVRAAQTSRPTSERQEVERTRAAAAAAVEQARAAGLVS